MTIPLPLPSTSTTNTTSSIINNNNNNNNNNSSSSSSSSMPMLPLPPLQPLAPFNLSSNNGEEISTIFVVGFPEDMLEREFQNMFIFSPGFEAATLKIPNKDQEDDMMANTSTNTNETNDTNDHGFSTDNNNDNNEINPINSNKNINHTNNNNMRKQIIGFAKFRTRMEALEARDIISGRKVDAEKGSVLKAEMAKKNLHTKRGLSLEPLQLQQQQIQLGFPTQVLSPPINPSPYSNVLQQLAPIPQPPLSSVSSSSPTVTTSTTSDHLRQVPPTENMDLYATSPIAGGNGDYLYSDLFSPTLVSSTTTTTGSSAFKDSIMFSPTSNRTPSSFDMRTASVGDIFNTTSSLLPLSSSLSSSSSTAIHAFNPIHRLSSKHVFEMEHDPSYLSKSTPTNHFFFPPSDGIIHPTAPPPSTSSSSSLPVHQQHYQHYGHTNTSNPSTINNNNSINNSMNNNNISNSISNNPVNGLSSVLEETDEVPLTTPPESLITEKDDFDAPWQQQYRPVNVDPINDISHRVNGLAISTNPATMMKTTPPPGNNNNNNLTSPIGTSPMTNTNGLLRNYNGSNGVMMMIGSTNPADQNPPCNTLYVGNLPPNTSEDELKQLFSKCVGYKRLSFRHKSNGPMCFVEFVDVMCATQALQDLYGNPLSNSVKGGIRLSFSKNPLGVRQPPQQSMGINSSNSNHSSSIFATSPPPSASNMNFGFMNGFPSMNNYPRRDSMTFDPQLS